MRAYCKIRLEQKEVKIGKTKYNKIAGCTRLVIRCQNTSKFTKKLGNGGPSGNNSLEERTGQGHIMLQRKKVRNKMQEIGAKPNFEVRGVRISKKEVVKEA